MKRILILVISLGIFGLDLFRQAVRRAIGRRGAPSTIVLAYHSVSRNERKAFAKQMDQLLRYAKPCRADAPAAQSALDRYVAVTFDDGYKTLLDYAIPELAERNIPATIFVVTGVLGMAPNWQDYSGGTDCAMSETLMTVEQLRAISSDLIQIGSHTLSHPMLPLLPEDEVRRELLVSRIVLEEILSQKVNLFSFPYGAFDPKLISLCRDAGYVRAFITHPRALDHQNDEFAVSRIKADPHDWPLEFYLKLHGAYRWRNKWHFRFRSESVPSVLTVRKNLQATE